jgi:hypothetical protein
MPLDVKHPVKSSHNRATKSTWHGCGCRRWASDEVTLHRGLNRLNAHRGTPPLTKKLKEIAAKFGKYPHAELRNMTNGKKKQKTRLIARSTL